MDKSKNLLDFLNVKVAQIVLERVEFIKNDIIVENDYNSLSNEITILLKIIEDLLPLETSYLINKLDELYNKQQTLSDEFMYAKGVLDGSVLKTE